MIEDEIIKYEDKFTQTEELNIFIGSWNVGGNFKKDNSIILEWLYPMKNMENPDIYIIGLQEIVNLNAKNIVLSSNSSVVEAWRNLISQNINKIDKYIMIKSLDVVGIFLIIFVKESLKEKIRNIESLIIRTGLLGTIGNKGSCLIRFNYLDTSVAISCCHLSSGSKEVNSRFTELTDLITKVLPNKNEKLNSKDMRVKDHDYMFLFGDLNFRIDLDTNTCINMIKTGDLEKLASEDQFNKMKNLYFDLIEVTEYPLRFEPTYKYIVGTCNYDTKKNRVPSWCDRILFKKNSELKVIEYNKIDYLISDHKPIFGIYKITVKKFDLKIKDMLINEIKENIEKNLQKEECKDLGSKIKNKILDLINYDFFKYNKIVPKDKYFETESFNKDIFSNKSSNNETKYFRSVSLDENISNNCEEGIL